MTSVNARIIKLTTINNNSSMWITELEAYSGGRNVAFNKLVVSTPTYQNTPANRGNDGQQTTYVGLINLLENKSYWKVDLGSVYNIDRIVLYKRSVNNDLNRINPTKLELFTDTNETNLVYNAVTDPDKDIESWIDFSNSPSINPDNLSINPTIGRIIKIRMTQKNTEFWFNELDVYKDDQIISRDKPTRSSGTIGSSVAANGVDGSIHTLVGIKGIVEDFNFWYVDLGEETRIDRITLRKRRFQNGQSFSPYGLGSVLEIFRDVEQKFLVYATNINSTDEIERFNNLTYEREEIAIDPENQVGELESAVVINVQDINASNIININYGMTFLENTDPVGTTYTLNLDGSLLNENDVGLRRNFIFKKKADGAKKDDNWVRIKIETDYFEPPFDVDFSTVAFFFIEFRTLGQNLNLVWSGQKWMTYTLASNIISYQGNTEPVISGVTDDI